MDICLKTVYNRLRDMNTFWRRLYLKPYLTEERKAKRMEWAIFLAVISASDRHRDRQLRFRDMYDCVMVDEKWFYLTVDSVKIRLLPGTKIAIHPKVHHKRRVEKIMFLSCVARPLFNEDGSAQLSFRIQPKAA